MIEKSIYDIVDSEPAQRDRKANKLISELSNLKGKGIFSLNEIKNYQLAIVNNKSLEELNMIGDEIFNKKNIRSYIKSLIIYVMDSYDRHMVTSKTKDECIKMIYSIKTVDELEQIESQVVEMINVESSKIIDEYNILVKKYINK